MAEIDRKDDQFNKGVSFTVNLLAKTLKVSDFEHADGECVCTGPDGIADFAAFQAHAAGGPKQCVAIAPSTDGFPHFATTTTPVKEVELQ